MSERRGRKRSLRGKIRHLGDDGVCIVGAAEFRYKGWAGRVAYTSTIAAAASGSPVNAVLSGVASPGTRPGRRPVLMLEMDSIRCGVVGCSVGIYGDSDWRCIHPDRGCCLRLEDIDADIVLICDRSIFQDKRQKRSPDHTAMPYAMLGLRRQHTQRFGRQSACD
jgi:hypothetical protein